MQYCKFAVDETPYCLWEWDLRERNVEFLAGIDPEFFDYLAATHKEALDSDGRQYAAMAIRATYSQALETFFALLSAAIQAPDGVLGWMLRYRVSDLRSVVTKVANHQPLYSKLRGPSIYWQTLSQAIHQHFAARDPNRKQQIIEGFARVWSRLAEEFLAEEDAHEYNSIKHGLRSRPGGFSLAFGREDVPGQPARPENMRSLGGSKYGSSFFVPENLGDGKRNFRARSVNKNWSPEQLLEKIVLVSMSVSNTISFLQIVNGVDPTTIKFHNPIELEAFDRPFSGLHAPISMGIDTVISVSDINEFSKEDILAVYSDREVLGARDKMRNTENE